MVVDMYINAARPLIDLMRGSGLLCFEATAFCCIGCHLCTCERGEADAVQEDFEALAKAAAAIFSRSPDVPYMARSVRRS